MVLAQKKPPKSKAVRKVLESYDLKVKSADSVHVSGTRSLWKVVSSDGTYMLKGTLKPIERLKFSLGIHDHAVQNGGLVPRILRTRAGDNVVDDGEVRYYLMEMVRGRDSRIPEELPAMMEGLARFHLSARGYVAAQGSQGKNLLGRWHDEYDHRMENMRLARKIAEEGSASGALLSEFDRFLDQAEEAKKRLDRSFYSMWVAEAKGERPVCHHDINSGNLMMSDAGVYLVDLDNALFDLPVRDLRQTIVERRDILTEALVKGILEGYQRVREFTDTQLEVLFIDLLFPYEFSRRASKLRYKKDKVKKLREVIEFEEIRRDVVRSLAGF